MTEARKGNLTKLLALVFFASLVAMFGILFPWNYWVHHKAVVAYKPAAIPVSDVLACSRHASVFDPSEQERQHHDDEDTKRELQIDQMGVGDVAWTQMIYKLNGRLYVFPSQEISPTKVDDITDTHIKRTAQGFLVDCSEHIEIFDDDKSESESRFSVDDLIPVIGQFHGETATKLVGGKP